MTTKITESIITYTNKPIDPTTTTTAQNKSIIYNETVSITPSI